MILIINKYLIFDCFPYDSYQVLRGNFQIINAEVPQATMQDYSTALRSMSSGRGMFKQEFSHYEDMPINEAEKVISHYQSERALGH